MSPIEKAVAGLLAEATRLERENQELRKQVALLGETNNEQCDVIHELRGMLERAVA